MTAPTEPAMSLRASVTAIVRKAFPWLFYTGLHSFRVDAVSGGRVDLVPSGARRFKAQRAVYQWPGVAGGEGTPAVGSEVVLAFLDNDPNRPALVSFQPLALDGGKPTVTEINATTAVRIGRDAGETTVGAPGSATLVARASTVDANFNLIAANLAQIWLLLAPVPIPPNSSAAVMTISTNASQVFTPSPVAVGKLKSQ